MSDVHQITPPTTGGRFQKGHERIGGRPPGSQNKTHALVRAGLRSAIETLRNGQGENPVQAALKIARFLEGMSQRRLEALGNQVGTLALGEFEAIRDTLGKAADIHLKLTEFAFPKLARIDVAGEAPALTTVQQTVVTLNIGDRQPNQPQPPTVEHDGPLTESTPAAGSERAPDPAGGG